MIIDDSYFVREINIPQLSSPAVSEALDLFIEKYEKKFLQEFFGSELAELIVEFLETEPEPIDERISFILDGATFTYEGKSLIWRGLRNEDKLSPLANFVFYWFQTDSVSFLSQSGESLGSSENSSRVSSNGRLVFVWNEMVEGLENLKKLMEVGEYPEYDPEKVYEIQNSFNL